MGIAGLKSLAHWRAGNEYSAGHERKNVTELVRADAAGYRQRRANPRSGGLGRRADRDRLWALLRGADSAEAVAAHYAAKGRPDFNPLIVHVARCAPGGGICRVARRSRSCRRDHWPGPLTLVLPEEGRGQFLPRLEPRPSRQIRAARAESPCDARAGLRPCRFRFAAPSANPPRVHQPHTAQHVLASLDGAD